MRQIAAIAALVVAVFAVSFTAQGEETQQVVKQKVKKSAWEKRGCHKPYTRSDYLAFAKKAYAGHAPLTRHQKKTEKRIFRCQKHKRSSRVLVKWQHGYTVGLGRRIEAERARLELIALTPFDCGSHGRFAVPCVIVERESRYDPRAMNSTSTAGGYYQFIDSTWYAYGGSRNGCSHPAACASPEEQHIVAARAWAGGAGASHWALTYP